jgi:hypothetical protein
MPEDVFISSMKERVLVQSRNNVIELLHVFTHNIFRRSHYEGGAFISLSMLPSDRPNFIALVKVSRIDSRGS